MKKLLTLIITLAIAMLLAACGGQTPQDASQGGNNGEIQSISSSQNTPITDSDTQNTNESAPQMLEGFKNIGTLEELPVIRFYTPESDNYMIQHGKLMDTPFEGDYFGCIVTFFYYDDKNELIDMKRVDFVETAQLDTFYQYQDKAACTVLGTEGIYTVVKYDSPDEYVEIAREAGETKEVRYNGDYASLYHNFQEMWDYGADAYYFSE